MVTIAVVVVRHKSASNKTRTENVGDCNNGEHERKTIDSCRILYGGDQKKFDMLNSHEHTVMFSSSEL